MSVPSLMPATGVVDWANAGETAVRRYCGWHIAPPVTETITLDNTYGGRLLQLPSLHVGEVSKLEFRRHGQDWGTVPPESYVVSPRGVIELVGTLNGFPCGTQCVRVTLTHGYELDDIADVQAIVKNVTNRASMELGAISSQSVNGASVSYATAGGSVVSTPLLQIEKQALDPYKLPNGIV